MKIKILYEDEDILAIDKPPGLAVHDDDKGRESYTLVDWIVENRPNMKEVGEEGPISRPGIVHRLDKDTSGVLVLAKNQRSYKILKKQFQDRAIKKVYLAVVYGNPKKDSGIIDRPIGRSRGEFAKRAVGGHARGELKGAVTYYRVLERFEGYTLLELRPQTGRTHQLRVHLKSISYPIVCDSVYARGRPCLPGLERLALHAFSIDLKLPSGKDLRIESPLSKDINSAIVKLRSL